MVNAKDHTGLYIYLARSGEPRRLLADHAIMLQYIRRIVDDHVVDRSFYAI